MTEFADPPGMAPPFSSYSHSARVRAGADWLVVSGQAGVDPEGRLAEGAEAEATQSGRTGISLTL